jgi:hypothetical protein
VGVLEEQSLAHEDHARGAVAALDGEVVDEGLLQGVEGVGAAEAFDGDDFGAVELDGEDEAGVDGLASQEYRAGAAFAASQPRLAPVSPRSSRAR